MRKRTVIVMALLASCSHNRAKVIEPMESDKKVIRVVTGSMLDDSWPYESDFKRAANKACPNGYQLLERTREPDLVQELDHKSFYWVIRCK